MWPELNILLQARANMQLFTWLVLDLVFNSVPSDPHGKYGSEERYTLGHVRR